MVISQTNALIALRRLIDKIKFLKMVPAHAIRDTMRAVNNYARPAIRPAINVMVQK
jgi:hypothetical protein